MTGRLKINDARLKELWPTQMSCEDIGAEFDVTGAAIAGRAKKLGLPKRKIERKDARQPRRRRKIKEEPKPDPAPRPLPKLPPHPKFGDEKDAAIFRTNGNYEALAGLARKWTLPVQMVQQRYHRLNTAHG